MMDQLLVGTACSSCRSTYLEVDHHHDDFLYDMATGGFYAGVGLRF